MPSEPPGSVTPPRAAIAEVRLLALAGPPPAELATLTGRLSLRLTVPCRLAAPRGDLVGRELLGRGQLDADSLLARLEPLAVDPAAPLVGVTDRDFGLPIFTHVFGRGRLAGNAAVVSLARLRPEFYGESADGELLLRRGVALVLHELGHLAGLEHCRDANCLMHFCSRIEAADVRGSELCADCAGRLPADESGHPAPFRRR